MQPGQWHAAVLAMMVLVAPAVARAQDNSAGGSISGPLDDSSGGGQAPPSPGVQPETFSYPVGLDPAGDNFLALRSMPSAVDGVRLARLGPDALFAVIGRAGAWLHVRLPSGEAGWVSARYVGCCRTARAGVANGGGTAPGSCDDLWLRRNSIYKAAGYCFRTDRAIAAFGNDGCRYDTAADVPLSGRERAALAALQDAEAAQGCPR